MSLPISIIVFFAVIGVPLFCALAGVGLAGFHHIGTPLPGLIDDVYQLTGGKAVSLSTIPLFTFAGYLMARAKTATRLVAMSEALLGPVPGGLAVMTVMTSAFFTVFTGASGVTIVALGGILLPQLERSGYKKRFALGTVTGSGAVGLLFPPALPLIVYGIVYGINVGMASGAGGDVSFSNDRFLFAGILPGIVLCGILSIYCVVEGARSKVPRTPVDLRKFFRALWEAKWEWPIPFVIILLMVRGIAQIHEVAAITAVYVFVVEVFIYRDIDVRKDLFEVTRESMTLVGAIFMKIFGATILTGYLIEASVPDRLFTWMSQYVHSQWAFLLVMNVVLLLVGCLMDIFSAIVVMVPLIVPAAMQYHINPYHLGVIFLLNLEIGYLLPPAGLNLFIAAFRFDRPITELYRAVLPFIALMIVALGIVTYVPSLTEWSLKLAPKQAMGSATLDGATPAAPPP